MLRVIIIMSIVFVAFCLGVWYGAHDRQCVTADANGTTVVYCANGRPAANFYQ